MFRLGVSGIYRPAEWLSFVGELRSEDLESPTAYAAYVRLRPWRNRSFDIQAGRIPPVFGSFGRRQYETGNPVIGYPLAYQYLTSLRTDAIPATADDVLRMRARGWRSSYPIGAPLPGPGIPLISGFQWDTGVEVTLESRHPGPGRIGDQRHAVESARERRQRRQTGRGADRRHACRRLDSRRVGRARRLALANRRARLLPGTAIIRRRRRVFARSLDRAMGAGLEPVGLSARAHSVHHDDARRARHVGRGTLSRDAPHLRRRAAAIAWGFRRFAAPPSANGLPWDAPVRRVEGAIGYYLQRNFVLRTSVQGNWREGGRDRNRTYLSGQLVYWF